MSARGSRRRRRPRWLHGALTAALACVAWTTATVPAARADETPGAEAKAHARELYLAAEKLFAGGHYDDAIELYARANAAAAAPVFLFDIAQCHRLAGRAAAALHYYRAYLAADPTAPNRADVEVFIRELERGSAVAAGTPGAAGPRGPATVGGTGASGALSATAPPAAGAPGHTAKSRRGLLFGVGIGAGAVVVAAAVVVGVLVAAGSAADRFGARYPGQVIDFRNGQ